MLDDALASWLDRRPRGPVEDRRRVARHVETAIDRAYHVTLSRPPSSEERDESLAFIRQQATTYPAATAQASALADFCHVLVCLNEFVYVV